MKQEIPKLVPVLLTFFTVHASADTRYVDLNNLSPSWPYTDWSTAASTIQDAIDAADPGDMVLVTNGVYATGERVVYGTMANRVAVDKAVTVQSVNGPLTAFIQGYQVPGTTNGDGAVRCVYLADGATLIGFTLTNGATRATGSFSQEQSGGGAWCQSLSAVLSNCVLNGNSASSSGGGARSGTLKNCVLTSNSAGSGGGAASSTLTNCTLIENSASNGGGAASSTLDNCILKTNWASSYGGAAYNGTLNNCGIIGNSAYFGGGASGAALNRCTITGNSAREGGGARSGSLTNCKVMNNAAHNGGGTHSASVSSSLVVSNSASYGGGGAYGGTIRSSALTGNQAVDGGGGYNATLINCNVTGNAGFGSAANGCTVRNCILWYNGQPDVISSFVYSCNSPALYGSGGISAEPQLASSSHLSANSPCRGAGNSAYATGGDIDGEMWLNPPSIGCDEFHSGKATGDLAVGIRTAYTSVALGFRLDLTGFIDGPATASRWEFGDGTVISNRPYGTSHAWGTPGDHTIVLRAYNDSNPSGITATTVVHVAAEVHYVAIDSSGSSWPYDSWATAATNIQDAIDAAALPGAKILVSNGVYRTGGRVVHGALTNRVAVTKPVEVQSVNGPAVTAIEGYQVPGSVLGDAAIRCVYLAEGARLSGFALTNGATRRSGDMAREQYGGGVWCESPYVAVSNCVLFGNAAHNGGGAAFGQLTQCTLLNNHAGSQGGGAFVAALNNCIVINNSAVDEGGGVYGGGVYYAVLDNCVVANNEANGGGGAWSATLKNCTIVGNKVGSAVYNCTLYNCVSYYNAAGLNYGLSKLTNCCTSPLPASGAGNFTNSPLFIDMASGNLRLQPNSPCINAGSNDYVSTATDLDGRRRIDGSTVDVGAYELQPGINGLFIGWLQQHNLPTDGSADFTDADGEGMSNWQEWVADTIPTNSWSALRMLSPVGDASGVTVRWESVSTRSYWLERSSTPTASPAFSVIATNLTGVAGTKTYLDPTATNAASFFYRVGVH